MASLFWALLLTVLVPLRVVFVEATPTREMEPRLWQHELKKTYCELIQRQRIYKLEQLDVYCAGKVGFFDDELVNNSALEKCPFFCLKRVRCYFCRISIILHW